MTKLFVDDIRECPPGYILLRDYNKVLLDYVCSFAIIDEISLDHDMGEDQPTGYDFLCEIERLFSEGIFYAIGDCKFTIHSANPVGRQKMLAAIASIERLRLDKH